MSTRRHPAGRANYRGDMTHMIGEVKGPTTFGVPVVAVAATYDSAADRTSVAFAYLAADDEPVRSPQGWRLPGVTA